MSIAGAIAIYFIIWWTVLFAVLPWGVKTQVEEGRVVPGSAPSAPGHLRLGRKLIATSIVAAFVFAIVYVILTTGIIGLDDIPFLPEPPALS